MPISQWFPQKKTSRADKPESTRIVPDGLWSKCAECNRMIYQKELHGNLMVCPQCDHHYPLSAEERLVLTVDAGSFKETDAGLVSADPLSFRGQKPYAGTLVRAKERTGMSEAIITGAATIGDYPVVIGIMDFRFVGASMGSAVGEKVTRAAELAREEKRPLVLFCASGGARMQEGMFSLLQMAKTSAAIGRLQRDGVPYLSVLTDPTTGGVSASFAALADIVFAEPKALIGFAGPRVIEQTIRERLPKDFQRSEFLLKGGMIDQIVPRAEVRDRLTTVLSFFTEKVEPAEEEAVFTIPDEETAVTPPNGEPKTKKSGPKAGPKAGPKPGRSGQRGIGKRSGGRGGPLG